MIVVLNNEIEVDALDRALRQGGFVLRARPGGLFELTQVNRGRPVCHKCESNADVRQGELNLCVEHYKNANTPS